MAIQYKTEEKRNLLEVIRLDYRDNIELGIKKICSKHGISTTTYYRWIEQERKSSFEPLSRKPKKFGNKLDDSVKKAVIQLWEKHPHLSANKIHKLCLANGHSISYNTVNKIIKQQEKQLELDQYRMKMISKLI